MSNILKVFIVLNFILSVVFLATSATLLGKAENWKGKYEELDKAKSAEIKDLSQKLNVAKSKLDVSDRARVNAIDEAQDVNMKLAGVNNQLVEKKRDYEKLNNNLAALQEDFRTQTQALKQAQTDRERYEKRTGSAEEKARNAITSKETAENDARRLEAKVAQYEEQIAAMERDLNDTRKDLGHQKNLVAMAINQGFKPAVVPPPLDAVVQSVNPDYKYVMLSVGRDDKVFKGVEFTVSRNGKYVGDVKVDNVYPKACSATFVRVVDGMNFQAGDTATTRR